MPCPACQGSEVEYNPAEGNSFCRDCGLVLEENAVVNDVTFGESASGQATVFGSHVGANKFGVAVVGPGGRRQQVGNANEQSAQNGRSYIIRFANGLNLTERYTDAGMRYYNLALASRFTKGRSTEHVAAACLYAACRQEGGNKMLIDFSELLRVNVFVLGGVYLKLVKLTGIRLPPIDPSFFMLRFAAALQFAELTEKVSEDGCRLVKRFKADWMHTGRRPSGVCGAALLISARMHNFYRTIQEVAQVVKVAPATIRKRLQEFAETPSADLNVKDFRAGIWLDKAQDPPSFRRARRMTTQSEEASQSGSSCSSGRSPSSVSSAGARTTSIAAAAAGGPRAKQTESSIPHDVSKASGMAGVVDVSAHQKYVEVAGRSTAGGSSTHESASESSKCDPVSATAEMLPNISGAGEHDRPAPTAETAAAGGSKRPREDGEDGEDEEDENSAAEAERRCKKSRTAASADEVVNELLQEAEQIPRAEMGLSDLDDDSEIEEVLHTEQEVLEKRRVWEAHNKDWEEAQEAKYRLAIERGEDPHAQRVRKRGGTRKVAGANSATAADSVKKHLESKLSSKINYAAVESMFEEDPLEAVARAKARGSVTGHAPMAMALMGESDGTLSRTRSSTAASRFRSLGRLGPGNRRNALGRAFGLAASRAYHPYEV